MKTNMDEIFVIIERGEYIVVCLKWDASCHVIVEMTEHLLAGDATRMAMGMLWQKYGDEIILHIQTYWTKEEENT